jgi:exoribonuclease-2
VSKEKLVFLIRLALQEINPDTEMAIALSGLPVNFSPEVMQAAETISEFACHHSLTDMRELDCITIDAADTQDIDDALSMEATEQGWRLGIHISLLSWFFMPDNILEQEANKRTSSLYANQTDINMLPERLSYQLASLVQGKQRPALSLFCYFDEDFQLLKTRFQLTVIQVRHRYTYDEVDLLLDDANADNPNAAMQIRQIALAAVAHLHKRKQACRYIVENPDIQPSRRLVAECMVIFNLQAALFAKQQQLPFIYRCLENDIITQNSNDETEQYLIPGSVYTAQPVAHQAMGNSVYAQATSPLRRYADLINQRQLVANLNGAPAVYSSEFIDGIIPHLNRIRKIMHTLSR